jgi:hypothetical protein
MTPISDIRIVLELGDRRCAVTASMLERELGLSDLRGPLLRLLFARRGEDGGTIGGQERNGSGNEIFISFQKAFLGRDGGCKGEGPELVLADAVDAVADVLVDALADKRSRAWYRIVAERVPLGAIRGALAVALEPSPRDLRRSRGALFTAVVRRSLDHRR